MSDQPAAASKVCGSCGADVTSAPRVKDAQGNYFCRECAAKKQAELSKKVNKSAGAPAAAAPLGGDPDIMAKLVADSMTKGANACPACRRPWKEGAIICTGCGFSKQTGQMVGTQIHQPTGPKGPLAAGNAAKAVGKAAAAGMAPILAAAGAAIGGAVGAGIWAAVAYNAKVEVGYIAWAVGALTGAGAAIGARQYAGIMTGMIAVGFAVVSIIAAKFMAIEWILKDLGGQGNEIGVMDTLKPIDLLFFGLAIVTAAGVGSKGQISFGGGD